MDFDSQQHYCYLLCFDFRIFLLKYLNLIKKKANFIPCSKLNTTGCNMENAKCSKHNTFSRESEFVFKIKIEVFYRIK